MRKRIVFAILMLLGMILLIAVAESNWPLAGLIGLGLGATVAMLIFTYPNDIAPPADRRHENTQRRRAQRESLR
jgi:4-hydroxybenzoate polyprenyltransferase